MSPYIEFFHRGQLFVVVFFGAGGWGSLAQQYTLHKSGLHDLKMSSALYCVVLDVIQN